MITNLANDKTLTQTFSVLTKDLKVTDNGDGTMTILVLATGSGKVYGPDGKLLFNDPGQIRFEVLIDHGGTPTNASDDEFLEFLGQVKGSTGRNDLQDRDFCADIHEFIGSSGSWTPARPDPADARSGYLHHPGPRPGLDPRQHASAAPDPSRMNESRGIDAPEVEDTPQCVLPTRRPRCPDCGLNRSLATIIMLLGRLWRLCRDALAA